ncbi:type III secretion system chaperone SpaK [[Erwinia] mediterraneensis]|uniref:InvB/SpaK family type III secretion system chaperone n=1 Tax=[Erwinia] mediterraneensis TaxID=2161819 RepID=UPI0010322302|nr:type III secretion system chaperone SpaK [[Erwinia] mediterraneensis]
MDDIDIAALLRGALRESGCDEALLNNFDGHSTIELECADMPSILISKNNSDVWLWAKIYEDNSLVVQQKSADLLPLLMEECAFSITEQLQLTLFEGHLVLKGLVKPDYLRDSKDFAIALETFFERLNQFLDVLR